jgi:hypothetical protein
MAKAIDNLQAAMTWANDLDCLVQRNRDTDCIEGVEEMRVAAAIFLERMDALLRTYPEKRLTSTRVDATLLDLAIRFGHKGFAFELARLGIPLQQHLLDATAKSNRRVLAALLAAAEASPAIADEILSTSDSCSEGTYFQEVSISDSTPSSAASCSSSGNVERIPDIPLRGLCPQEPEAFESDAPLASLGSAGHDLGYCKPCVWYWRESSCNRGSNCLYCHVCDEGALARRLAKRKANKKGYRQRPTVV